MKAFFAARGHDYLVAIAGICVAAAVVGTAAVGTKAATDPRSAGRGG